MRKPRITAEGAKYHVAARANHRALLLDSPAAKTLFLEVLAQAKRKFSFRLDNFVVMGNHVHLIIQPQGASTLSLIMKWILQTFAIRFNKVHGLWGHFWGDRFSSWIIPNAREFLRVFRYLDLNPVRAGIAKSTTDWPWGALWMRRNHAVSWLDPTPRWLAVLFPEHRYQTRARGLRETLIPR